MTVPAQESTPRRLAAKGLRFYKAAALIFCNTLILFLILNSVLWVVFKIKDTREAARLGPDRWWYGFYGEDIVRRAYPEMAPQDLDDLLRETWTRPYAFEAYTHFKERPHKGKWVTVDKHGFRHARNQGPWPPDPANLNIFFFGGSTAFGYGVGDEQTVASYLQEYLNRDVSPRVKVYNFGRGNWYSTQERTLFEQLLVEGFVPRVALFLDGINDGAYIKDQPMFVKPMEEMFDRWDTLLDVPRAEALEWRSLLAPLPVMRLARALTGARNPRQRVTEQQGSDYNLERATAAVLKRYPRNMALIEAAAQVHGVTPVFVWQPRPGYLYDTSHSLFHSREEFPDDATIYPAMKELFDKSPELFGNVIWLADIQEHSRKPHYIDAVHYSAAFSKVLADHIGRHLVQRNVLPPAAR